MHERLTETLPALAVLEAVDDPDTCRHRAGAERDGFYREHWQGFVG